MKWKKFWLGAVLFFIVWAFSTAQADYRKPICKVVRIQSVYIDLATGQWGPDEYKVHFYGNEWDNNYYKTYEEALLAVEKWIANGHCSYESRRLYPKTKSI